MTTLANSKSAHFIGIGGIGISAIARMLLLEGKKVSGSDRGTSRVTDELAAAGALIITGHNAANIADDVDCVVYTIAIPDDNPELVEARRRGITVLSYPEALGEVSKDKFTIAVSGTHGKTTTTAMIAQILIDAGLDPTVIVGSMMIGHAGNFISGKSNILVVEACEYRRSFLNINPDIIVITNVDEDHLDYYKDLADIQSAFAEFTNKLTVEGHVVANLCQAATGPAVETTLADVHDYSEIEVGAHLLVPGDHNYENAKAALAVADLLHIDLAAANDSLAAFKGTWRRFERKGEVSGGVGEGVGAVVFDDYAHHPTEIAATLAGAKKHFQNKRIIAIFQPHLYSRTASLIEEFGASFGAADRVIVLPIYAAREAFDPTVSSSMLVERINTAGTLAEESSSLEDAEKRVRAHVAEYANLDESTIIITLGAGDVSLVAERLVKEK